MTGVNTLFISWLNEWKNEAAERDSKTQYTYAKALRSIKKYPLCLSSGLECKMLEGFGDKLCSQIDERLQKEMTESGVSSSTAEYLKSFDSDLPATKAKKIRRPTSSTTGFNRNLQNGAHLNPKSPKTPKKNLVSKGSESFIPHKNSGSYALLLTLANHHKSVPASGERHLSKQSLMELAQPLSNASFKIPPPGSRYTAWSSMGTLLKKQLIIREGYPAKYTITADGLRLVDKILRAEENSGTVSDDHSDPMIAGIPDISSSRSSVAGSSRSLPRTSSLSLSLPGTSSLSSYTKLLPSMSSAAVSSTTASSLAVSSLSASSSSSSRKELLQSPEIPSSSAALPEITQPNKNEKPSWFTYIQEDGMPTWQKDKSVVSIDEVSCTIRFLIRAKYMDLVLSGKKYTLDFLRSCDSPDEIFAYLHDSDAPDTIASNNAPPSTTNKTSHSKTKSPTIVDQPVTSGSTIPHRQHEVDLRNTHFSAAAGFPADQPAVNFSKKRPSPDTGSGPSSPAKKKPKLPKKSQPDCPSSKTSKPSNFGKGDVQESKLMSTVRNMEVSSAATLLTAASVNKSEGAAPEGSDTGRGPIPAEADFVMPPGSFEIVLLIDNRESQGPSTFTEELLVKELVKNKVKNEVRQLQLGDFFWIARSLNSRNELVLDYIVERKRMDDLAGSIIDGRFREQKFRLSNCGLANVVYLVEDYGKSMQHFSIPEATLNQAIVNTQVVDDFQVKRVKSAKDSAKYLTLMTRFLQSQYRQKTLCGFRRFLKPPEKVSPLAVSSFLSPDVCLMTYEIFSENSMKSKCLTVSELFIKHLTQISGVSSEKAISIVQKYPTPLLLYEAYRACCTTEEREKMLSDIKCGALKRNLGVALSRTVASVYYNTDQQTT